MKKEGFNKLLSSRLFKNSSIYTITGFLNTALNFFLMPIFTRVLTPEEYGLISIFTVAVNFFTIFIGLNISGVISVKYYNISSQLLKKYIYNTILIFVLSGVVNFSIVILVGDELSSIVGISKEWLVIAFFVATSGVINNLMLTIWRAAKKSWSFGYFRLSNLFVQLILSIVGVVIFKMGAAGRILPLFITALIFATISLIIIKKKWVTAKYNYNQFKDAFKFGFGLIPHALSGWIFVGFTRLLINHFGGLDETGIYVVGYQVGMVLSMVAIAFNDAWTPYLMEKLVQNNELVKIKIVRFTYMYFIAIHIVAIILIYITPFILNLLVGEKFINSKDYVPWIILKSSAGGCYYMVVNYIFYRQKTLGLSSISILSALFFAVLSFTMVKYYGPIGAAFSSAIIGYLTFGMVWLYSAKVYKMPWFQIKKILNA